MRGRLQARLIPTVLAVVVLTAASVAAAQEIPDPALIFKPPDESRLIGRAIPDVALRHADGREGRLSDLWNDRPVFVTLVFSRCAGICSPYLGLLKKTVRQVGSSGERYQMAVLSFDVNDRPKDLQALARHHGLENDPGWTFAVATDSNELAALCRSLDFDSRWDEQSRQFNHPAITVALRAGKVVRLSVGEEITPRQFTEMLSDARGEFVSMYPVPGRPGALFRCFDYDPQRGFTPNWGMLILIFPAVAALTLAVLMFLAAGVTSSAGHPAPASPQSSLPTDSYGL